MKTRFINFFKETYQLSPIIFYAELIEAILLIGASAILMLTILDPATEIFIPLYFVGSLLGFIASTLRRAGFVMILTGWFTIMNFIALTRIILGI